MLRTPSLIDASDTAVLITAATAAVRARGGRQNYKSYRPRRTCDRPRRSIPAGRTPRFPGMTAPPPILIPVPEWPRPPWWDLPCWLLLRILPTLPPPLMVWICTELSLLEMFERTWQLVDRWSLGSTESSSEDHVTRRGVKLMDGRRAWQRLLLLWDTTPAPTLSMLLLPPPPPNSGGGRWDSWR